MSTEASSPMKVSLTMYTFQVNSPVFGGPWNWILYER